MRYRNCCLQIFETLEYIVLSDEIKYDVSLPFWDITHVGWGVGPQF